MAERPHAPLAVAIRIVLALAAAVGYLGLRSVLDAGALAAARFGLGILLFALLLDLGRSVAGTGRPVRGALGPHRQRAEPQVDEAYERLRSALATYVDEGDVDEVLVDHVREAADAQDLDEAGARRLDESLREAARPAEATRSLLAVRLLAGLVVTLGLGLAAATVAENLGIAVIPPVLLVTGTSIATLQWRARPAGARWTALGLGLAGLAVFTLGALRFLTASTIAGGALLGLAGIGLLATLAATVGNRVRADPWDVVETRLEARLAELRRAFLVTVLAGIVVFALEGLLAGLFAAGIGPELAAIALATATAFLAIEGAGTWLTLTRGRRSAQRDRKDRRRALARVLEHLDREATDALEDPV